MENDTKSIWTGLQQRFCRDTPASKHIVSVQNRLIIEVNIGERVEAIKHQIDMVMPERRRIDLKRSLILPICQADPLQAKFVVPIEWVRDETVAQQVSGFASVFLSAENIGDNRAYERDNSNPVFGRVVTVGVRLHY